MNNEKTKARDDQALHPFVTVLAEIENKEEIQDHDIIRLTNLLAHYSTHPASTEEGRLSASKELDRVNAIYLSKNKS